MKSGKILVNCILTSVLAVSQNLIPVNQNQAKAQSVRPYAVFVNGWQNCCAWGMNALQNRLINQMNAEPRYVPYNNFDNNGSSGNISTDERFLSDGADFINNKLDRNRPLILIGHSFGGDSVLKLLPRINRRIQFVGVIDPVRTGGFRATLKALTVPSSVDYFFNRWQTRVPFPNDFGVDGSIKFCNARVKCDQDSQNIKRFEDSSPHTRSCTFTEKVSFQCPGSGKVQLRLDHQSISIDAYIQRQIGDRIQEQLTTFRPPPDQRLLAEARQKLTEFYRQYLQREPEAGAIEARIDAFLQGRTLEQQRIEIENSTEAKLKKCPNQNIDIRPTSSNLEFRQGQAWTTCSNYKFVFRHDGNLVLYNQAGEALWATGTNNRADLLAVQTDGNVVLYGGGVAVWATNTNSSGAFLSVQSDGNVVVYSSNGSPMWATNTRGR